MKIGVIGSGMIGSTVGKLWIDAGHEVRFASRHPEKLQPLVKQLGKRATLALFEDADHSFRVLKSSGRTDADVLAEIGEAVRQWISGSTT